MFLDVSDKERDNEGGKASVATKLLKDLVQGIAIGNVD